MRVLVSFEREYRVYMEAIASAIRHSDIPVAVTDAEELEAEVGRFVPQLIITSLPVPENLVDEQLARIELSPDTAQPSRFRVGERHWESTNPTLSEILSVVDETKRVRGLTREKERTDVDEEEV
ncbi:MAG TPA: hypothetical protein VI027_10170 [Rubrobacteraceae bacterium]